MSERILMKFIVGQRVVKQGEDSRFEGQIVACFVKRDLKTLRYVVENDDGVLHIASERQLSWPCLKLPARLEPSHSRGGQVTSDCAIACGPRRRNVQKARATCASNSNLDIIAETAFAAPAACQAGRPPGSHQSHFCPPSASW